MAGQNDRERNSVEPESLAERTRWPDGPPGGRSRTARIKRLILTPARYWRLTLILSVLALGGAIVATGSADDIAGGVDGWIAEQADEEQLNERQIEKLVHERVNEVRAAHDRQRLDFDETLREIARGHSTHMGSEGFYSHESPSGKDFQDRYADAGYSCRIPLGNGEYAVGSENLASTYAYIMVETSNGTTQYDTNEEVANAIVEQWLSSEQHRENLLKRYWDDEGIGVALSDRSNDSGVRVYVTQNFC